MSLKQLLSTHRDHIVSRFVRDVARKDLPPENIPLSVLIDHIPTFLDELGRALSQDASSPRSEELEMIDTAREHGVQRWKAGYDLSAVVREYGVLRHAILEVAREASIPISGDDTEALAKYLNLGVASATDEYVQSREDQLRSRQADLEFICEAGELLSSSLDYQSILARLTRLVVPRLADICIVHLDGCSVEDMPVAHANPAKVVLVREILRRYPWPRGAHGHSEVVRMAKSVLVSSPTPGTLEQIAQTPEQLTMLRELGVCSWLAAPLQVKASIFGTITLAWSDSGRHYADADLLLVNDLARRAASAIDNAQLYELARTERASAESAARAKDEFVAVVSHELRTPLNVIIGWVRLLRGGSLPEATREHALEVVERNADAQNQLVTDLLDISRVLTGKVRLEPAQVDFGNLLRLVVEDARLALDAKRLQMHLSITEPAVMRGDAERLKQVVWNLLLNAIKFTPKGGSIRIGLSRVDSELELSVQDDGVGIAPDVLPYVFRSFHQANSTTRTHGGLGLGLSITKHLVELHGGSIVALSDGVGKGSEFRVRLPLSPVISTTVGVTKGPVTTFRRQGVERPAALAGVSILIVDDEDDARDLLRIVLESCNAQVYDAASAREALEILATQSIDLMVSDIGMPDEDGYTLIRAVRALSEPHKANLPAIALTAFARNEDRSRALLEGFNVHMSKPVEPAELLVALADLCGRVGPKSRP
jgi:signal transduction histidine kinase/CheY-like chemotaxis protein